MAKKTITIREEDFDEAVYFFLEPDDECEDIGWFSRMFIATFSVALKCYLFDREVSVE